MVETLGEDQERRKSAEKNGFREREREKKRERELKAKVLEKTEGQLGKSFLL